MTALRAAVYAGLEICPAACHHGDRRARHDAVEDDATGQSIQRRAIKRRAIQRRAIQRRAIQRRAIERRAIERRGDGGPRGCAGAFAAGAIGPGAIGPGAFGGRAGRPDETRGAVSDPRAGRRPRHGGLSIAPASREHLGSAPDSPERAPEGQRSLRQPGALAAHARDLCGRIGVTRLPTPTMRCFTLQTP